MCMETVGNEKGVDEVTLNYESTKVAGARSPTRISVGSQWISIAWRAPGSIRSWDLNAILRIFSVTLSGLVVKYTESSRPENLSTPDRLITSTS